MAHRAWGIPPLQHVSCTLFTWDFGNMDAFLKGRLISWQTKGHSGSRALDGPHKSPPMPRARPPSPPRHHPPSWALWGGSLHSSGRQHCLPAEKDGQSAAGKAALWERKPRHLLGAEAPGCPVRKPSGPWVCSQGRLIGCALAASQETQNVPSQYSRSIWVGSSCTASLWDHAFAIWKATSHHCSFSCPSVRPRRLAPLSPCPRLPSVLPPAAWGPLWLLPVTYEGTSFRSLSWDWPGGERHI